LGAPIPAACLEPSGGEWHSALKAIMPKSTAVDRRARALCVELARVTAGRPLQWRMARLIAMAAGLDDAAAYTAIAHAIRKGWLIYEGDPPHICLTNQGRAIAAGADD
jgi:hypothetical protein